MTETRHFWYDGHHGEIINVGRERWETRINGETFDTSGFPAKMKENMVDEMQYRVDREPDFDVVCHGLLYFLDQHVPGRNGDVDWVLMDSVQDEVIMNDSVLCLEAGYALKDAGLIEMTKVYDTPGAQIIMRPDTDTVPDPESLSGCVSKVWL